MHCECSLYFILGPDQAARNFTATSFLILLSLTVIPAQTLPDKLLSRLPIQALSLPQTLNKNPNELAHSTSQEPPQTQTDPSLVAINFQRFEKNHDHADKPGELELKHDQLLEAKIAAIPDQIIAALPEDLNKQLAESTAEGKPQIAGAAIPLLAAESHHLLETPSEDPDQESIERLTKSCLTVHAISAKPEQLNVSFHLYTRLNPTIPYIIRPEIERRELIGNSPFHPGKSIKWITHGFHTNLDKSEWMLETKGKILEFEDANVILSDWRKGASPALAFYPKAAANAHVVAKMIVNILRRIRGDIDLTKVHLIGHSLGAHIMGFVGSAFTEEHLDRQQNLITMLQHENQTGSGTWTPASPKLEFLELAVERLGGGSQQLIGRITACDPALPCFGPTSGRVSVRGDELPSQGDGANHDASLPKLWTHLRPDSAIEVEVMHSNPGVMGYAEPLGDYDFYPNGISKQPGCGLPAEGGRQSHIEYPSKGGGRLFAVSIDTERPSDGLTRGKRQLHALGSLIGGGQIQQSGFSFGLSRIFKPIRDFFQAYTCSHHRAVEYMIESLYYDQQSPKMESKSNQICQLVGYRCSSYEAFKRGYCFKCQDNIDCRIFTMTSLDSKRQFAPPVRIRSLNTARENGRSFYIPQYEKMEKFNILKRFYPPLESISTFGNQPIPHFKRALPTINRLDQHYRPTDGNHYFFDTGRVRGSFCLHHYNLLVKYRWFKVKNSISIDGFHLVGSLLSINQSKPIQLNMFNPQSFTMLLTEPHFLGRIESLTFYGDLIKASLVDYIEINYMSNLDPSIRALGSAQLCRFEPEKQLQPSTRAEGKLTSNRRRRSKPASLFVSCSGLRLV